VDLTNIRHLKNLTFLIKVTLNGAFAILSRKRRNFNGAIYEILAYINIYLK